MKKAKILKHVCFVKTYINYLFPTLLFLNILSISLAIPIPSTISNINYTQNNNQLEQQKVNPELVEPQREIIHSGISKPKPLTLRGATYPTVKKDLALSSYPMITFPIEEDENIDRPGQENFEQDGKHLKEPIYFPTEQHSKINEDSEEDESKIQPQDSTEKTSNPIEELESSTNRPADYILAASPLLKCDNGAVRGADMVCRHNVII